ncbi:MAG: hypothetical protein ACK55I_37615, partial [bacterium]
MTSQRPGRHEHLVPLAQQVLHQRRPHELLTLVGLVAVLVVIVVGRDLDHPARTLRPLGDGLTIGCSLTIRGRRLCGRLGPRLGRGGGGRRGRRYRMGVVPLLLHAGEPHGQIGEVLAVDALDMDL